MAFANILVRVANWVGDAVMSLPALEALHTAFPAARISVLARPWVADLYSREPFCHELIPYTLRPGAHDLLPKIALARQLRSRRFDCAILFQNAFEAAALTFAARIPTRIGYARDGRSFLLTRAVARPQPGETPAHQRFYYLELLRRAGIIASYSQTTPIRLTHPVLVGAAVSQPVIGISPGAAYGGAKRWLPERFAAAAIELACARGASVAIFGSAAEASICQSVEELVSRAGISCRNFAGATTLGQFIERASACELFLTNDSGPMHIASALGVPTVAIFGATDHEATGPTGARARVIRHPVECSPCLLRECPIDHRCMLRVSADEVAAAGFELLASAAHATARDRNN